MTVRNRILSILTYFQKHALGYYGQKGFIQNEIFLPQNGLGESFAHACPGSSCFGSDLFLHSVILLFLSRLRPGRQIVIAGFPRKELVFEGIRSKTHEHGATILTTRPPPWPLRKEYFDKSHCQRLALTHSCIKSTFNDFSAKYEFIFCKKDRTPLHSGQLVERKWLQEAVLFCLAQN